MLPFALPFPLLQSSAEQGSDAHAPPTIPELIRSKSSEEVWVDVAETGDSFCAYVVNRHTADAQDTFSHFAQQLERGSGIHTIPIVASLQRDFTLRQPTHGMSSV